MTISLADLETMRDTALHEFDERVRAADPDVEVARLESQLLQLYRFATLATRREESLPATAALWKTMVAICDAFAVKISTLCAGHPASTVSHDRILDLRNWCARLEALHD